MLRLHQWRQQCSQAELASFEQRLCLLCAGIISDKNLKTRYDDSLHKALVNRKVMDKAMDTGKSVSRGHAWDTPRDAGHVLCEKLADADGEASLSQLQMQEYCSSADLLLQRGVLFKKKDLLCLPAEIMVVKRNRHTKPASWYTMAASIPLPMLRQIVPESAQTHMLKPLALQPELAGWVLSEGLRTLEARSFAALSDDDWRLLLSLHASGVESADDAMRCFPDFEAVTGIAHYYYNSRERVSFRKSLEKKLPEPLIRFCRMGLAGIHCSQNNDFEATIKLSAEARKALRKDLQQKGKQFADEILRHWEAKACPASQPSPWSMDHDMWRLWIALHFLSVGVTRQGKLKKNDLKKLTSVLNGLDVNIAEFLLIAMIYANMIAQKGNTLTALAFSQQEWSGHVREAMLDQLLESGVQSDQAVRKQACALLAKLPVECWLKLDDVVHWLKFQSTRGLERALWHRLFAQMQGLALHHYNTEQDAIYLLQAFHETMQGKPAQLVSPGWRGAQKKAALHGFVSAAGEIQLPPDCSHGVLHELAGFCTLVSVEQMITLQLDQKALLRLGSDKAALKKIRTLLQSLQSPLPQAVAYLFDKQLAQKPVATAAAAAMALVIRDASALASLRKTGFSFSQPFPDKPELILLDASADSLAFLQSCADHGIKLDTLIKPVQWISGTASIKAWMESAAPLEGRWLDISYQKTRAGAPKPVIARLEDAYGDEIFVLPTRKRRQGFVLLTRELSLQPKHILRLCVLSDDEAGELGLPVRP